MSPNGRWSERDGLKGDAAIEAAREKVDASRREGKQPDRADLWLAGIRTSYEGGWR